MEKYLNIAILITISIVFANCIPTSVLVDTKEQSLGGSSINAPSHNKVKRAPETPSSHELSSDKPKQDQQKYSPPQKRAAHSHNVIPEFDLSNDIMVNNVPNGVWEDSDAGIMYPDLQDFEDYQRNAAYGSNRQKSYENLQNLLNSQYYSEPIALPVEYPYNRYGYGDRKKRASGKSKAGKNLKKNKREISPADMLTLVALIEANERARLENKESNEIYQPYDLSPQDNFDSGEWSNSWSEPGVQYYGMPFDFNAAGMPHSYNSPDMYNKERHSNTGKAPSKRFMVAKRKRSLNLNNNRDMRYGQERFLSDPQQVQGMSGYDYGRYAMPDFIDNGGRNYHNRYY